MLRLRSRVAKRPTLVASGDLDIAAMQVYELTGTARAWHAQDGYRCTPR